MELSKLKQLLDIDLEDTSKDVHLNFATSNVDSALSSTSTHPVENKVVKAEFDKVNSNLCLYFNIIRTGGKEENERI